MALGDLSLVAVVHDGDTISGRKGYDERVNLNGSVLDDEGPVAK